MFCGKTKLGKLERLQERALSPILLEKPLSYDDLLKKYGLISVRINLIHLLSIEVLNVSEALSYLNDMLNAPSSCYAFRNPFRLLQPKFNTYGFGYKSFKYFGSKVWIFSHRIRKGLTISMRSERSSMTGVSQTKPPKSWKYSLLIAKSLFVIFMILYHHKIPSFIRLISMDSGFRISLFSTQHNTTDILSQQHNSTKVYVINQSSWQKWK